MIHDLELTPPKPTTPYDVCIVGSGAAGIVLALELLAQGKRILMLEGGGPEIEDRSQDPYRSEVVGLNHTGIHTGRFRAKGGTTTKWGGQILEFDEHDFEIREAIPESGWPFPKSEIAPFYPRSLEGVGLGNVERDDAAVWHDTGLKAPRFDGFEPYFSRWLPDPLMARVHRKTLEENPNLDLWLHASVVEILFEGEAARAVRTRTLTGIEAIFEAPTFIFALGAIESSRFFLQPRAEGLPWNRSGLLGKHYQDHIDVNVADVKPTNAKRFHDLFDNVFSRGFKYHPKIRLSPAIQRAQGTLNAAATMYFVSDVDAELVRIRTTAKNILGGHLRQVTASDLVHALRNLPLLFRQVYRYGIQHRAFNPPSATIKLRIHCEQQPDSPSSITLSQEKDGLGLYRTRLDWQITDAELATIRACALQAQHALAEVAVVTPDPKLLAGDPSFRLQCDDSNHHMGGMRMALSPEDGVVDPNLRLHGTRNVYVCSSAVFPTSSFSNPTHTLLALAARLAKHLEAKNGLT
jgi:choline dehydrogenase-like flavoprotein